jgi:hypothetical protein
MLMKTSASSGCRNAKCLFAVLVSVGSNQPTA